VATNKRFNADCGKRVVPPAQALRSVTIVIGNGSARQLQVVRNTNFAGRFLEWVRFIYRCNFG
jgi:hypothetical protein